MDEDGNVEVSAVVFYYLLQLVIWLIMNLTDSLHVFLFTIALPRRNLSSITLSSDCIPCRCITF